MDKNIPDLIDSKIISSNSVRLFNKKIYDQCHKKETCDVYEKIKLGWEVRKLGSWEAGWSEADLPVRQRTQTGIPIHRGGMSRGSE